MDEIRVGKWYIIDGHCCGSLCITIRSMRTNEEVGYSNDDNDEERGRAHYGTADEKKAPRWRVRYRALLRALEEARRRGRISKKEADDLLKAWLEKNPDPDQPIEVTKELEAVGKPIPVQIPERERVDVERRQ